jgi:hypothetical protein
MSRMRGVGARQQLAQHRVGQAAALEDAGATEKPVPRRHRSRPRTNGSLALPPRRV